MYKFLFNIVALIILAGAGYHLLDKYVFLCDIPVQYSIGKFDERFGISQEKFIKTLQEAEQVWEKSADKDIFEYIPDADFKVNLAFDERQQKTLAANRSEENIEATQANYDLLHSQYEIEKERYEMNLRNYDTAKSSYNARVERYNQKVASANARGGATAQEYKELQQDKQDIQHEANELESKRESLNQEVQELNSLGNRINELAAHLNIKVDIHNEVFGGAREFDQADYTGRDINVYQFDAIPDLRLVLAHELGHSLGMDHVENPKSIMHYLMDKQDLNNPTPTIEDIVELRRVCSL